MFSGNSLRLWLVILGLLAISIGRFAACSSRLPDQPSRTLTGEAALGDASTDAPGVRRKITVADLPTPFTRMSPGQGPNVVPWPEGQMPKAPEGFKVERFATGLKNPRIVLQAPCGDVFVAESRANKITVLRDTKGSGQADVKETYAQNLSLPFGMAFYPPGPNPRWLYVADTDQVLRYPYQNGDLTARAGPEVVIGDVPGGGQLRGGGHWSRALTFKPDGSKLYLGIGSLTDAHIEIKGPEDDRAVIREYNPDGTGMRVVCTGIRNPVTIAFQPKTGDMWASVNERDFMGDHLPPDYITRIKDGGFYGWPWYYIGPHEDPRHAGKHPELKEKALVPDVLVQTHSASLGMCFYMGSKFPKQYREDGFAAFHGSSGRTGRTGYKIIRVPLRNGIPTGEYEDFVTGFVAPNGDVYGRLVDVKTASDGSMLFTDDGAGVVWRVSYVGK